MVPDEAKLAVQSYSFIKDIWLYLKNKQRYAKKLEDNLTELTADLKKIDSRKAEADRKLDRDVSTEKSVEHLILEQQIQVFNQKYKNYVNKYIKDRGSFPVSPAASNESGVTGSNQNAMVDVSLARLVIKHLQERKPTIFTHKFFRLAKLSREIKRLHDRVASVLDKIKPENLLRETEPEHVQVKEVYTDIPSFSKYVNEIVEYLEKDDIRSIGIGGEIGVGKTTVLKMLNNQLKDTKHGVVIWVDYPMQRDTQDSIVEAMQDVIIGRLKLIHREGNPKKDTISKALHAKKYILLIDQVISHIDLDEVGISKSSEFGKVVVASINKKVLSRMTDHIIKMQPLPRKDAIILFKKIYGGMEKRIQDIAEPMIESCGGLPLVIMTLAWHLKDVKNEDCWNGVKNKLQSEFGQLKLAGVGNAYKMVYDELETNVKKCLLFGALFPSGHDIYKDHLVECWTAERFLDFPELRSARYEGERILKDLTDRFLMESSSNESVKMPEFFRKMALQQQYPEEENSEIWAPVPGTTRLSDADKWQKIKRMAIYGNFELPQSPISPKISALLLQCNPELRELGEQFFDNMKNLRILDLNRTGIRSLPSSISSLVSLFSLYLNDCSQLSELPTEAEKLESLEFLDIRGTSIPSLPEVIGCMVRLRCLRVLLGQNRCNRDGEGNEALKLIPPNIISKLVQLEELTIEMGCCSQSWNDIAVQILEEVAKLERLTTLRLYFPSVHSLGKFVSERIKRRCNDNTFRSFKIFIGCCKVQHPYGLDISGIIGPERQLRFSSNDRDISSVKEVLQQASAFELIGNSHVDSLSEFALEKAESLKVCIVKSCKNLQSIVKTQRRNEIEEITEERQQTTVAVLQFLEKLHLFDLQSLQSIWDGSVFPESLSRLKVLTLCGCHQLVITLNPELAKSLSSLEHLKVEDCSKITDIVKVDSSEDHRPSASLHKLETIELENLPKLENIWSGGSMNWKSLRKIVVNKCSNLVKLHFTVENAKKIKIFQCERSCWEDLVWERKSDFSSCFVAIEPELVLPTVAFHKGESSSNTESVNTPQASDESINEESRRTTPTERKGEDKMIQHTLALVEEQQTCNTIASYI